MKTRLIAAAMVLVSLWGVGAPLALAASIPTPKQRAMLKTHTCCPREHAALAVPFFVSPTPASMPCGGQSPCCAKQSPAKPALLALNPEYRPGLESTPVWTNEMASNSGTAAVTSADGLSSLFLHSTALRI